MISARIAISFLTVSVMLATTAGASAITTERKQRPITVGLGVIFEDKVYDDYSTKDKFDPVPIIFYEGERLFFRADTLGWKLISTDHFEIAPIIAIGNEGYDSSDSDTLSGMDDREAWVGAGAHAIWQPGKFGVSLEATGDITDESNGGRVITEAFYDTGSNNTALNLNVGTLWGSEGYSEYYWGVESDEVIPGIRPAYNPDSTLNFYFGGSTVYQRPDSPWMFITYARYTFLDGDVDDSPITDSDHFATVGLGVAYQFRR